MKLTSMYGSVLIFVHEWGSTTNKKANIYCLYCYWSIWFASLCCSNSLWCRFPKSQLFRLWRLSVLVLLWQILSFISSPVEFTPGSFCRNRCLRLGVLNNNSNCFKRAYQIWLIMTAYSCKIFLFFFKIILNLHLVPQSAACAACRRKNPLRPEVNLSCGRRAERRRRRCERKDFLFRTMTCFCRPFSSR